MVKKYLCLKTTAIITILLCALIYSFSIKVQAEQNKTITLSKAVTLSINNSREYKTTKSKIFLKQAEYEEAVKSIALKKKNMSTFRWTPLLSFKFPEKADLADEYEFTYKPLQIQSEISSLKHKLSDIKYSVTEEVSNLYVDIYTYEETISYKEAQLENMEEALKKNTARLALGQALQEDIDSINTSIESLMAEIALKKRELEIGKQELSELIGIDISVGYTFTNPYKEGEIGREKLAYIEEQTLEKSQTYYDAKLNTQLALTSLNTNYSLMEKQYGSKMSYISSFINMAKRGEEIDSAEFKLYYNRFLTAIDSPWNGSIRILFIKIPKEWFKGSIDGIRYVEDEPYALYTAVLEYQEALTEQEEAEKEIRKEVQSSFENMITAKNAYNSVSVQAENACRDMERGKIKNHAGEITYSEYEELKKVYEDMETEKLEALKTYTQVLYSFDRLTCGTITGLLSGTEYSGDTGQGGESVITEDVSDGAYYYINTIVEDNAFEIGIYVPEECEVSVNRFELWVDNVQVGERTDIGKTLKHLTLTVDNAENVFLRLYSDDVFVADAVIDVSRYQGELPIEVKVKKEETSRNVGSWKYEKNQKTGMATLKLEISEEEEIHYFRLVKEESPILSEEPVPVNGEMSYLPVLIQDISHVTVEFYDKNKEKTGEGYFDENSMLVFMLTDE